MKKKMVSGSSGKLMQYLAEQISNLTDDSRRYHYRLLGQQYAMHALLEGLRNADPAAHQSVINTVESVSASLIEKGQTFGEDNPDLPPSDVLLGKEAFSIMAAQMREVVEDGFDQPQPFRPAKIDAGTEDT